MPARHLDQALLALEFRSVEGLDLDDACLVLLELRYIYELQVLLADDSLYVQQPGRQQRRRVTPRLEPEDRAGLSYLQYGSPLIVDLVVEHAPQTVTALGVVWAAVRGIPNAYERWRTVGPRVAADNAEARARLAEADERERGVRRRMLEEDREDYLEHRQGGSVALPDSPGELARALGLEIPATASTDGDDDEAALATIRNQRERLTQASVERLAPLVGGELVGEFVLPGERRKTNRPEFR